MSLIGKKVSEFNLDAYKQGEFVKVSDKDLAGKWSVLFFYPADFTFVCPTELEDLQNNMTNSRKKAVRFIPYPATAISYIKHGMKAPKESERYSTQW